MASSLLSMLVAQKDKKRSRPDATTTPQMEFKLSTLDQVMDRNYTTIAYFYKTAPGVRPEEIFSYLYEAFQLTTSDIPILRGHIATYNRHNGYATVKVDPGRPFPVPMRDLTSAGAEPGAWRHGTMSDIEARGFPNAVMNDPALRPPQVAPGDGAPVFVVQITFIDGGMVFFNAMSHVWADLTAANTMYTALSRHCAALSRGQPARPDPLPAESFDRTRLSAGLDVDLPFPGPEEDDAEDSGGGGGHEGTASSAVDYVSSTWRIPAARLARLKAWASRDDGDDGDGDRVWISTGDAVNALFWRSLARSPWFAARGKDSSRAAVAIDFRRRLTPPVPPHYFGNAATAVVAELDAAELVAPGRAAVRDVALRLRRSIREWDGDAEIPLAIGMINAGEGLSVAQRGAAFERFAGHDVLFADHSKAGVYRFDWGKDISRLVRLRELGLWGAAPVSAVVNVYPLDVGGNAEVRSSVGREALEWLLGDEELREWVDVVDSGLGTNEEEGKKRKMEREMKKNEDGEAKAKL